VAGGAMGSSEGIGAAGMESEVSGSVVMESCATTAAGMESAAMAQALTSMRVRIGMNSFQRWFERRFES